MWKRVICSEKVLSSIYLRYSPSANTTNALLFFCMSTCMDGRRFLLYIYKRNSAFKMKHCNGYNFLSCKLLYIKLFLHGFIINMKYLHLHKIIFCSHAFIEYILLRSICPLICLKSSKEIQISV